MIAGTRVAVERGKNESSTALIRRFTRRAQGLGLVREMRDRRYWHRIKSKNVGLKRALVNKARRARDFTRVGHLARVCRSEARAGFE